MGSTPGHLFGDYCFCNDDPTTLAENTSNLLPSLPNLLVAEVQHRFVYSDRKHGTTYNPDALIGGRALNCREGLATFEADHGLSADGNFDEAIWRLFHVYASCP
ncbi:hypothetical protein [Nocardioides pelophilus]|uniref:hypothetical protein n=1 Tax=Nocardioides pelophilus TaxID=2172019 RepID=UPI0015FF9EC5|nr:hypothetical protein [Nocardioides pelophilus]